MPPCGQRSQAEASIISTATKRERCSRDRQRRRHGDRARQYSRHHTRLPRDRAKFTAFGNLSLTLMLGMFLAESRGGGECSMLTKAGYRPAAIFGLWSTVLLAGVVAAAAGKAFIGSSDALTAIFAQALAGGAVLALVAHAMIPVALEEGGSLVVLPTVAGFLFALYLALANRWFDPGAHNEIPIVLEDRISGVSVPKKRGL